VFKNRAFQVKMVRDDTAPNAVQEAVECTHFDPKEIAAITSIFVERTITAVFTAYAGKKVLDTICKIAVISAKAKIR
jgi:hypothetical protein